MTYFYNDLKLNTKSNKIYLNGKPCMYGMPLRHCNYVVYSFLIFSFIYIYICMYVYYIFVKIFHALQVFVTSFCSKVDSLVSQLFLWTEINSKFIYIVNIASKAIYQILNMLIIIIKKSSNTYYYTTFLL